MQTSGEKIASNAIKDGSRAGLAQIANEQIRKFKKKESEMFSNLGRISPAPASGKIPSYDDIFGSTPPAPSSKSEEEKRKEEEQRKYADLFAKMESMIKEKEDKFTECENKITAMAKQSFERQERLINEIQSLKTQLEQQNAGAKKSRKRRKTSRRKTTRRKPKRTNRRKLKSKKR